MTAKKVSELKSEVNLLAEKACRLMTDQERLEFFRFQEQRDNSNMSAPRPYARKTTYYKGKRKGELKDVYEIEGRLFNRIWELFKPYVMKSVAHSYKKTFINEYDYDEISEIRFLLFSTLRYFGPQPCNTPLSSFIQVICSNVLTNSARSRYLTGKSKLNYSSALLSDPVGDYESSVCLADTLVDTNNCENDYNFWLDVPAEDLDIVTEIVSGNSVGTVAKNYGISRKDVFLKLKDLGY